MTHKPWTRKEESRAAKMRRCGCPCWLVGRVLGRSTAAVMMRLWELGVRRKRRQGELSRVVRRLHAGGWFDWEIALELGCTESNVSECRQRLGLPGNDRARAARQRERWRRARAGGMTQEGVPS